MFAQDLVTSWRNKSTQPTLFATRTPLSKKTWTTIFGKFVLLGSSDVVEEQTPD